MSAQEIFRKHSFGKKPPAVMETLARIHQELGEAIQAKVAPPGYREISKFERETLIEALTQITDESKKRKAAEEELAAYKIGNAPGAAVTPVAESLSYKAVVSSRDAAGNLRTIELTPSDDSAQAYRIKVVSRDAAGDLRSFDLMPVEKGAK